MRQTVAVGVIMDVTKKEKEDPNVGGKISKKALKKDLDIGGKITNLALKKEGIEEVNFAGLSI